MRNTLHTTTTFLRLLPMLALAVALTACHDDDDDVAVATYLNGAATVQLHVSSDILGDLNATRADNDASDPYAADGEFMNTLCVFVVDAASGTIEAKFCDGILDGYEEALTGDLTEWTSEEVVLTSGTKTLYAFANWDYTESTEWTALIAKTVGESITSTDLNFLVEDPASKVDIQNGKYIPMSGSATTTVIATADLNSTQLLEVGMDRLVSKVAISVQGDDATEGVIISSFSFSGWADKVPLMSGDKTETYEIKYENAYSNKEMNKTIGTGSSTSTDLVWFYVNETYPSDGFTIKLDANIYEGTSYCAVTSVTDIPRNCILPITLTLDTYTLQLTPTAWTSILGVDAELAYTSPITFTDDTYYITMLDVTSTFSIAPALLLEDETAVSDVSWTWKYLNEDEAQCDTVNGTVTMTQLTATPGYEYPFTLTAQWTNNSTGTTASSNKRTYNVKVIFTEGFPSVLSVKAARPWRTIGTELLSIKPKD